MPEEYALVPHLLCCPVGQKKTASTPEGTLAVVFDSAAIGCASVWKITEQTTERACLSVPAYPPVRQW